MRSMPASRPGAAVIETTTWEPTGRATRTAGRVKSACARVVRIRGLLAELLVEEAEESRADLGTTPGASGAGGGGPGGEAQC